MKRYILPTSIITLVILAGISLVFVISSKPRIISQVGNRSQLASALEGTGSGLVGWWKFDEGSGTTAGDSSGNNYTASFSSPSSPQWTVGKIGNGALSFDGQGSVTTGIIPISNDSFSFSFWMKTGGNYPVIGWSNLIFCYVGSRLSGYITCTVTGDSSGAATSQNIVTDNSWHHIVFTSSTSTQSLYVDGVLEGNASQTMSSNGDQIVFGTRFFSSTNFQGSLDDIRVYNHVLSPSDVTALYSESPSSSSQTAPTTYTVTTSADSTSSTSTVTVQTTHKAQTKLLTQQILSSPQTWYVDSTATCSVSCDGTSWATAWTALDQVPATGGPQPGDTIYISGGPSGSSQIYYTDGPWKPFGGTANAWITWQVGQDSLHNGTVVLDGSHGNPALVEGTGIELYGTTTIDRPQSNYIILSGKVTTNGVVDSTQHMKLQNYWDVGVGCSSGSIGIKLEYIDFGDRSIDFNPCSVTQLEISHVHIHLSTGIDHAIGLGGIWGDTWGVNSVHDSLIEVGSAQGGVSISGGGGSDGIQWGSAVDIYNNTIRSYYTPYPYTTQHQDGIQSAGQYMRIYNNYCENMLNSCFFIDHLGGGADLAHIWIYNNVLVNTVSTQFNTTSRPIEGTCEYPFTGPTAGEICPHIDDIRVYDNTIVDFPLAGINFDVRNSNMSSWTLPIISNFEIRNNIIVNDGYHSSAINAYGSLVGKSSDFTNTGVTGVTVSNNLIDAGSQGSTGVYPPQTNSLSWTPGSEQFTWYTQYAIGNDFHLLGSDTSARGGGANLFSYFTTDKDGIVRPSVGSWDTGAYQYVPPSSCTEPNAFFTVSAATGYASPTFTVNFDASASYACTGSITSYRWDFGDGTSIANNISPSHSFGVGAFPVTLTVTNNSGQTSSITRTISAILAPVPGLILGVNFDNNVTDWSGIDNTSVWTASPCYTTGLINNAGCFDGTGSSVAQITPNPLNDLIQGTPQITIAGWAKKSSASVTGGFIGKYTVYELSVGGQYTGGPSCITTTSSGACLTIPSDLNDDTEWHHYALTYDGSTITLYVDGVAVTSAPLTGTVASDPYHYLIIGTQPFDSSANQFSGDIDDVRIYNTALSAADIQALYNSRISTTPPIINNATPFGVLVESTTAVTLSATTNEAATCRFSTRPNTAYSSMSSDNTFSTSTIDGMSQTFQLSDLSPGSYNYYVRCEDVFNNVNVQDTPISFVIAEPPSSSGLVLHYDFQDDFTHGTLTDTSPTGDNADCQNALALNGTTYDQCPTKTTGPDEKQAASLSGSVCWLPSTSFAVPKVDAIDHLSQGTISIWANYNPSTDPKFQIPYTSFTYQRLLDTYTSGAVNTLGSWAIARDTGLTGNPGTSFIVDNGTVSPFSVPFGDVGSHDTWNHYVITWNSTTVALYLNGILVQLVPESGFSSLNIGTYLTIGGLNHGDPADSVTQNCSSYVGTYLSSLNEYLYQYYGYPADQQYVMPNAGFFVGKMGDIRIYNRALSPAEVAGVYAETGGTVANPTVSQSYTVNSSAGTGGSVSPSGSVSVNSGDSQTFTVSPTTGYQVNTVTVDGFSASLTNGTYTFSNVTTSHSISVTFSAVTPPVTTPTTYSPGGGGGGGTPSYTLTVSKIGSGTSTTTIHSTPLGILCGTVCSYSYLSGTPITLTASTSLGYHLVSWNGCTSLSSTSACLITLTTSKTITATFSTSTALLPVTLVNPTSPTTSPTLSNCPLGFTCTTLPGYTPYQPPSSPTSPSPSSLLSTISPITLWLTLGTVSPQVKTLQQLLNATGFTVSLSGNGSPSHETTYFGPATAEAVKKFQCSKGIICQGLPTTTGYGATGPKTRTALNALITTEKNTPVGNTAHPSTQTPPPTTSASTVPTSQTTPSSTTTIPPFTRTLKLGSTGTDVKNLQIFLNNHGFTIATTGNGSPNHETTYFGPATKTALIKFQNTYAKEILTPYRLTEGTGIFGATTMKKANEILAGEQ